MNTYDEYNNWVSVRTHLLPEARNHPGPAQLKNWALVLSSRNIPHKLIPRRKPTELLIPAPHLDVATHEIRLYLKENQNLPTATQELKLSDNTLTTLSVLALLGIFHNLTYFEISGFGHEPIDWLELGSANSTRIISGEWWRIVTSLTLHADGQHLLGNLMIGGYFAVRLCHLTGTGLGWILILAAGSIGNLTNAIIHGSGHNAVGASTAIFGAIGIAGAFGAVISHRRRLRYWLLPIAAACVLLAFLGSGNGESRTDIGAHLLGFLSGIGLGTPAAIFLERKGKAGAIQNRILASLGVALIITVWIAALI